MTGSNEGSGWIVVRRQRVGSLTENAAGMFDCVSVYPNRDDAEAERDAMSMPKDWDVVAVTLATRAPGTSQVVAATPNATAPHGNVPLAKTEVKAFTSRAAASPEPAPPRRCSEEGHGTYGVDCFHKAAEPAPPPRLPQEIRKAIDVAILDAISFGVADDDDEEERASQETSERALVSVILSALSAERQHGRVDAELSRLGEEYVAQQAAPPPRDDLRARLTALEVAARAVVKEYRTDLRAGRWSDALLAAMDALRALLEETAPETTRGDDR